MDITDKTTGIEFISDEYRWLVITVVDKKIRAGVYTDTSEMAKKIGISTKTLKRKMSKANGTGTIKVNGLTVTRIPYFKSRRGYSEDEKTEY